MTGIFISYRRDDVPSDVGRLYDDLVRRSENGEGYIFMDVNDIPPGVPFPTYLNDKLKSCNTLLALIGPRWLSMKDENTGIRRLDQADDWVRREIADALKLKKKVIPVLLQGAKMPAKVDLPEDLIGLAELNATEINSLAASDYWLLGLGKLIEALPGEWNTEDLPRAIGKQVTWKTWMQALLPSVLVLTAVHVFIIKKELDFDPVYALMGLSLGLGYYAQWLGIKKTWQHAAMGFTVPFIVFLFAGVLLYEGPGDNIIPRTVPQFELLERFVAGVFSSYLVGAILVPLLLEFKKMPWHSRRGT